MLVTSIFFFSHNVFKRLLSWGREKSGLCGKELNVAQMMWFVSCIENSVRKGENAGFQHFVLFLKKVIQSKDYCKELTYLGSFLIPESFTVVKNVSFYKEQFKFGSNMQMLLFALCKRQKTFWKRRKCMFSNLFEKQNPMVESHEFCHLLISFLIWTCLKLCVFVKRKGPLDLHLEQFKHG